MRYACKTVTNNKKVCLVNEERKVTKEDLYHLLDGGNGFAAFPRITSEDNKIGVLSTAAFEAVYGSAEAEKAINIIYFFLSEKPVPRLLGESRILYIGQTRTSFKARYLPHAEIQATSKANSLKFGTIIEKYGPISIACCDYREFGDSLLGAEGQFLWWYFQNHCEYPPLNYTKTKIRNDAVMLRG